MEIKFNVESLNPLEREYISDFILGYPMRPSYDESKIEHEKLAEEQKADLDPNVQPVRTFADVVQSETVHVDTPVPTLVANVPPPPVAPPVIPVATVAPSAAIPVELDKDGFPWDDRIHSSSREKIKDGTWKIKRGTPQPLVDNVRAQLRQLNPAPVVVTAAPPQPEDRSAFVRLIGKTSAALASGKITKEEVESACTTAGIAALPLLATRLDLIPQVESMIDSYISMRP